MHDRTLKRPALLGVLLWACSLCAGAATCNVTGGWIAFGPYSPVSAANLDTTGTLQLDCHGNFQAELSLSVGGGAAASYAGGRKMTRIGAPASLVYNLYADAARTQILGDGTGGSVRIQIRGKDNWLQPVYARIPALQRTVAPGFYGDVVIATISY